MCLRTSVPAAQLPSFRLRSAPRYAHPVGDPRTLRSRRPRLYEAFASAPRTTVASYLPLPRHWQDQRSYGCPLISKPSGRTETIPLDSFSKSTAGVSPVERPLRRSLQPPILALSLESPYPTERLMSDVHIQVPGSLTEAAVIAFSCELHSLGPAERYVLDLSRLGNVEPFGMLMCASILRRFVHDKKERGSQIAATGFKANSYAAHMGLYQAFGLPYGKKPGEASGSSRYIPLTCISVRDLKVRAGYGPVGGEIEKEAQRLARVLLQRTDGSRLSHISYALLEMMRNVVEHSFASEIWCAAVLADKELCRNCDSRRGNRDKSELVT